MKTLKNLIWMAALTLTAATWSACSNEDVPTAAEQPAQSRTYTVTTTLSPRNGAATRSTMTDNGDGSISAEWEKDDVIWVLYKNTDGDDVEATAEVIAVDPSTKAATIRVTLTNPKEGDSYITFGYPYNLFHNPKDPCNDQTGTLDEINTDFAAISGTGEMTVTGSDVTLPAVTMVPAMCIWKFSFTDGSSDITSDITKLIIDFPNSDPIYRTYTVTPTSLDNIYVAMYGDVINAQPINIYAQTASGVYRKSAASVTLAAGTTYTSTSLALSSAAAANAVTGDLGKLIGADGNIYPNASIATACGTTAVAIIAYVGSAGSVDDSNASYKGLAIAMSNANGGSNCIWANSKYGLGWNYCLTSAGDINTALDYKNGITCTSTLTETGHSGHGHDAAAAAASNNGTAAPTGTSDWFLPSMGQWNLIVKGLATKKAGTDVTPDLTDSENDNDKSSYVSSVITAAGGESLNGSNYWTSTEYDNTWAWYFDSNQGYAGRCSKDESDIYVRSVLAF